MRICSWAGLAATVWALAPLPRAAADEFDRVALYEKGLKSTVYIVIPVKDKHRAGSGSLIDAEQRLVVTCAHVVGDAEAAFCQFPIRNKDGSLMTEKKKYLDRVDAGLALKGKVLHRDAKRDLALVKLDKLPTDTPALPLAKESVRVGEKVINIGNPDKVEQTFSTTDGKVRGVEVVDFVVVGSDGATRMKCKAKMVKITNPMAVADVGGPWVDKRGYQIAVANSAYFDAASQNVNGAIDVTEVRSFLADHKIKLPEPKVDEGPKK